MIKLTVVGCSPAFPNPAIPSSSYLLETGGATLLVDCGHGAAASLLAIKGLNQLSAVLVSHMHPDHFFDLVPLTYARMNEQLPQIPLWLPPGGRETVRALQAAVGLPETFFAGSFLVGEFDPLRDLEIGDMRIQFAETRHFIPAWAMRFSNGADTDHAILYSSDTGWTQPVLDLAAGARLALVEATLDEESTHHEREGHMTAGTAAELARRAGVERLVLTHYPAQDGARFLSDARTVFGDRVTLAVPGDEYEI